MNAIKPPSVLPGVTSTTIVEAMRHMFFLIGPGLGVNEDHPSPIAYDTLFNPKLPAALASRLQ